MFQSYVKKNNEGSVPKINTSDSLTSLHSMHVNGGTSPNARISSVVASPISSRTPLKGTMKEKSAVSTPSRFPKNRQNAQSEETPELPDSQTPTQHPYPRKKPNIQYYESSAYEQDSSKLQEMKVRVMCYALNEKFQNMSQNQSQFAKMIHTFDEEFSSSIEEIKRKMNTFENSVIDLNDNQHQIKKVLDQLPRLEQNQNELLRHFQSLQDQLNIVTDIATKQSEVTLFQQSLQMERDESKKDVPTIEQIDLLIKQNVEEQVAARVKSVMDSFLKNMGNVDEYYIDRINDLEEKISKIKIEKGEMRAIIENLNERISQSENIDGTHISRITEIEERVTCLEQEKSELQNCVSKLKESLETQKKIEKNDVPVEDSNILQEREKSTPKENNQITSSSLIAKEVLILRRNVDVVRTELANLKPSMIELVEVHSRKIQSNLEMESKRKMEKINQESLSMLNECLENISEKIHRIEDHMWSNHKDGVDIKNEIEKIRSIQVQEKNNIQDNSQMITKEDFEKLRDLHEFHFKEVVETVNEVITQLEKLKELYSDFISGKTVTPTQQALEGQITSVRAECGKMKYDIQKNSNEINQSFNDLVDQVENLGVHLKNLRKDYEQTKEKLFSDSEDERN